MRERGRRTPSVLHVWGPTAIPLTVGSHTEAQSPRASSPRHCGDQLRPAPVAEANRRPQSEWGGHRTRGSQTRPRTPDIGVRTSGCASAVRSAFLTLVEKASRLEVGRRSRPMTGRWESAPALVDLQISRLASDPGESLINRSHRIAMRTQKKSPIRVTFV